MRIESPSPSLYVEPPRLPTPARDPLPSTDVVQLSDSPATLWEEARQSLIRDPMAPEAGQEASGPFDLTEEEQAVVDELRARDAEVRAHEAAHAAIGGGTPTYEYRTGPDGRQYAVGGQVVLDASGGSTAQGTIDRMRRLRTAALAPGSPSAQDMTVAAEATQREAAARSRMVRNQMAEVVGARAERTTSAEQRRAASAFEAQARLASQADRRGQGVNATA